MSNGQLVPRGGPPGSPSGDAPKDPPKDAVDAQIERLLDGLRPGQEKRRFAGWGREMRSLYGRIDPLVLRGAVTRYLALEDDLPRPAGFGPYIILAEEALARARRARQAKLGAPPPPTEGERQAERDRSRVAIERAREMLPLRLRQPRRPR